MTNEERKEALLAIKNSLQAILELEDQQTKLGVEEYLKRVNIELWEFEEK